MSVQYAAVIWNRQKRIYDLILWGGITLYLGLFILFQLKVHPNISVETLIIRATATLAFLLLHVILAIGPLSRLDARFLPLLYNRRHLGVSMFVIAAVHAVFSIIQFHALGDVNPIVSIFTSNIHYASVSEFPFQTLGFFAFLILFLMAATSHDFWLNNLSPPIWKSLHMLVYLAYALLVLHVLLGIAQSEPATPYVLFVGAGMILLITLHLIAGFKEKKNTKLIKQAEKDGFIAVCPVENIPDDRATVVLAGGENIAVFKYGGKISAVNNVCKHQNGPLGEGKIVDGCITCPWHGYQYIPENGQSPPPFQEKLATYDVKVVGKMIYVNPMPHPEGTPREPARI